MRLSSLVVMIAVIFILASTGCSSKAPGTTPTATVEAFVAAMNDRDAEAILGLMSTAAIAQMDEQVAKLKSGGDGMEKMALAMLGISESELATMDGKQFLMKMLNMSFAGMEKAEKEGIEIRMDFEIGEEKINGDHATVLLTDNTKGETQELPLIKEGDVWKLGANPVGN